MNKLLNTAIKETENLNQGEVFLVRDLFKGYEWNRISCSERLLLGTLSKASIQAIEKTSSGQQKYRGKCYANNAKSLELSIIGKYAFKLQNQNTHI